jgi:RsiW-degrading membrane proteinase PrsW (M82 family)
MNLCSCSLTIFLHVCVYVYVCVGWLVDQSFYYRKAIKPSTMMIVIQLVFLLGGMLSLQ